MTARKIIRDSDDDDDDVHLSPRKLVQLEERGTSGNRLAPCDSSAGDESACNKSSTGSTEFLAEAIRDAQHDLLQPTPKSLGILSPCGGLEDKVKSPTMLKLRRSQTTMEHTKGEKKKVAKTYGNKTTLDDLGLHDELDSSWELGSRKRRKISFEFQETTVPESSLHGSGDIGPFSFEKKKKINRRATTHGSLSMINGHDNVEEVLELLCGPSNQGSRLGSNSEGKLHETERAHRVSECSSSMLSTTKYDGTKEVAEAQHSCQSTIQDTMKEHLHLKPKILADTDDLSTRLNTEPIAFGRSIAKFIDPMSNQFDADHKILSESGQVGFGYHIDLETTQDSCHLPHSEDVAAKTVLEDANDERQTRNSEMGGQDEPAFPFPDLQDGSTAKTASKSKLKGKKTDCKSSDEPGLDEVNVGLPVEHYQPRPSRSRAGKAAEIDELFLKTDFSKVPEKIYKKKAKRRKTTGDIIVSEQRSDGFDQEEILKAIELSCEAQPVPLKSPMPKSNAVEDGKDDEVYVVDDAIDAVIQAPIKKKRGRPKKQAVFTEEVSAIVVDEGSRNILDTDIELGGIAPPPSKKGHKKKSLANHGHVDITSPKEVGFVKDQFEEECDDSHTGQGKPLSDITNSANITKGSMSSMDKTTPNLIPETTLVPVPVVTSSETPKKEAPKGPDRHSPLNSGKVPYRVGLSKRARIEPLLRIVKK